MLTESSSRFPARKWRARKPIRVILREQLLSAVLNDGSGSIAANSTRFGRARSSDEKIVLEPRLKVTVEDSLRHNMRLPFDASVETTKT